MAQKNVREYQRVQCIELRKSGMSYRTIGKNLGISRASVQRALERFEEIGGFQDRHRSGRPKKLNEQKLCILKHLTQDDDNQSSIHELTIKLNELLEKPICRRTVLNYLQRYSFEYNIKLKKPSLKKQHREARLQWCLDHSNWTINDWKQVLFSYESTFYFIKSKSEMNIWQKKDEHWNESCMEVESTNGKDCVGFWGIITWKGTGCCKIYNGNINNDAYCDILDNYLLPTLQLYSLEDNFIFQYDNARFSRSKQIQTKLQELHAKVLKWPTKSSDLNPIEQLSAMIYDRLRSRRIYSIKELIDGLSTEWSSITPELCEKLVISMPQRIEKCIAVHGNCIDY